MNEIYELILKIRGDGDVRTVSLALAKITEQFRNNVTDVSIKRVRR
jgi:hypothetical protein